MAVPVTSAHAVLTAALRHAPLRCTDPDSRSRASLVSVVVDDDRLIRRDSSSSSSSSSRLLRGRLRGGGVCGGGGLCAAGTAGAAAGCCACTREKRCYIDSSRTQSCSPQTKKKPHRAMQRLAALDAVVLSRPWACCSACVLSALLGSRGGGIRQRGGWLGHGCGCNEGAASAKDGIAVAVAHVVAKGRCGPCTAKAAAAVDGAPRRCCAAMSAAETCCCGAAMREGGGCSNS